jgi:leucyl-tRNA synthetase
MMEDMAKYQPKEIEPKWQKKWLEEKIYEPDLDDAKKPFYNLMMFPYPSAEGLHVGNVYAFTGADIYGRKKRMEGYDVFEPIGLDGFGIHSENYAMKIGAHPMDQAKKAEQHFYDQLRKIGNGFAWNERVETYQPEYYRWTQWLFVQMWKHGLAYRKRQSVNWCPKDQTVLSDEQVENGKCERCGAVVIKKELEQWSFRITNYADRLLDDLEELDWSEKVKVAQKNWIGRSEGAEIRFNVAGDANIANGQSPASIIVFTTRPDTLFGATYLVLAPEHELIARLRSLITNWSEVEKYITEAKSKNNEERSAEGREKTGVELKGLKAVNPANGEKVPIWVADYVLGSYGTGAIMAVPAHDERDALFARKFNIEQRFVIDPKETFESLHFGSPEIDGATITPESYESWRQLLNKEILRPTKYAYYTGSGYLINSGKFNGMDSETAEKAITEFVHGEMKTRYRLRDWIISRQRYWGPPIPMIFCDACAKAGKGEQKDMPGWYAVPEDDLPVVLPRVEDFRPTGSGTSPLATDKDFSEVTCPACGGAARRETDVSDTFLDSAWYYLRYLDPWNGTTAVNDARVKRWLPAALYTGGAEHSVLHLLYVRFVAMALTDWGIVDFKDGEPFPKFRAHGLIIKDGAKMSKSKGNVINPDEYIANFGADTLRMYLMFLAPFEQGGDFRDAGVLGTERFLKRVWKFGDAATQGDRKGVLAESEMTGRTLLHRTIKKVTEDIDDLHYNTAISALMILLNGFEERGAARESFEIFLKLLAPFAPHITEEIWRGMLKHETSIHRAPWPQYDPKMLVEDTVTLVLQVNGKVRDTIEVPATITESEAKEAALANENIKRFLGSATPKKLIYVEKKLVNIVA